VATKSHSQYEIALNDMSKSLNLSGHSQPLIFYTNNMANKQFLEECFPSLHQDVVPVEKYGHLEEFVIPLNIPIFIKNTINSINDAARTILEDVPQDEGSIIVGFDSEWNVEVAAGGRVMCRGQTAIIQIAYANRIYIFQVRLRH
jgi:hypothetical protein